MHIIKFNLNGRQIPSLTKGFCLFLLMLAGVIFNGNITLFAQGNLLITPRRVVFEGNRRSFDLNLANTGQDTATYAISIVQIRMTEDGGFETITEPDPGQKFADRFIRYFPRTVTLGPNESQVVKVQLLRSRDLVEGEYRSHFYFRAIPRPKPLGEEQVTQDTTTISVKLIPVFGITIPVIIRVGNLNANVSVTNLSLDFVNDTVPRLKMTFNRSGSMSTYGDITVDYISPQGKVTRVGNVNGVAVYTPNTKRNFQMNLVRVPGVDYRSGTLKITYSAPSDVKTEKYAEAELVLR
ncbi:MAG TPA: hypothetical protein PLS74_12160 [Bacteroidales bacterium]|nr:hypothetical protein [Bacteroidales bacterium]HOM41356.1 hypothetical protein [Bacteroidales bacterium]